jgi:Phage capsid family
MPYDNLISRTDAQALMPEEVSNLMLKGLDAQSEALAQFTRVPVGRKQVRFPVLSALPIAYWVTGDTGQKQTTEVNWDDKFLNIEEIAVIVPIPDSVLDDADVPIWDQVRPLCEQAAARTIDTAVFFGTDAPAIFPEDVVTAATNATNTATRGTSDPEEGGIVTDLGTALGALEMDGFGSSTGIAIKSLRGHVRAARNAQGDRFAEVSIDKDGFEVDGVRYTHPMAGLWPVGAGEVEAIIYDPAQFVIGVRQDITWKLLDQAVIQDNTGAIVYNLAQQDMVALRMVMRVGWQVANTINYDQPVEANRYPAALLLAA